jgi:hypothetical protein
VIKLSTGIDVGDVIGRPAGRARMVSFRTTSRPFEIIPRIGLCVPELLIFFAWLFHLSPTAPLIRAIGEKELKRYERVSWYEYHGTFLWL